LSREEGSLLPHPGTSLFESKKTKLGDINKSAGKIVRATKKKAIVGKLQRELEEIAGY
jgi:hypothetical protein